MSFDIYVSAFKAGQPFGVVKHRVYECFVPHVQEVSPSLWYLRYAKSGSTDVYINVDEADRSKLTGLVIHRPTSDAKLWASLFRVLQLGPLVLYFSGGAAPLVAEATAGGELPIDMIHSLGTPQQISSANEIVSAIESV